MAERNNRGSDGVEEEQGGKLVFLSALTGSDVFRSIEIPRHFAVLQRFLEPKTYTPK